MKEETKLKTLKFTVQKNGGEGIAPRWLNVKTEHASCPQCGHTMTVIIHDFLYAHCCRCGEYFIGE